MNFDLPNIVLVLLAYIIGSIPSAVWLGKSFYGVDVREYGSGNAGATNTFRVLGPRIGIPVLFMDIAKGYLAVQMAGLLGIYPMGSVAFLNLKFILGAAVLLGHLFPIFAGFRGGKGVATLTGIIAGIHPQAALFCWVIFLVVFMVTHYISLGSMLTALAYPFVIILLYHELSMSYIIFSLAVAIIVLITHQKNIERLLRGEETKMYLVRRKRNSEETEETEID